MMPVLPGGSRRRHEGVWPLMNAQKRRTAPVKEEVGAWLPAPVRPVRARCGRERMRRRPHGMSLPELLVAISILSILFGLLILPVMKAFGFIQTSTVRVEAQSVGRGVFETLVREVSDALYIYDNKDDPTESSLIMVSPSGLGSNAGQSAGASSLPPLLHPGPGAEWGVQPLVKHFFVALARAKANNATAPALPYWNQWEMENPELRDAGLVDIPSPPPADNLYRLFYAEYFLPGSSTPASAVAAFLLPNLLGTLYPAGQPQAFPRAGLLRGLAVHPHAARWRHRPVQLSRGG